VTRHLCHASAAADSAAVHTSCQQDNQQPGRGSTAEQPLAGAHKPASAAPQAAHACSISKERPAASLRPSPVGPSACLASSATPAVTQRWDSAHSDTGHTAFFDAVSEFADASSVAGSASFADCTEAASTSRSVSDCASGAAAGEDTGAGAGAAAAAAQHAPAGELPSALQAWPGPAAVLARAQDQLQQQQRRQHSAGDGTLTSGSAAPPLASYLQHLPSDVTAAFVLLCSDEANQMETEVNAAAAASSSADGADTSTTSTSTTGTSTAPAGSTAAAAGQQVVQRKASKIDAILRRLTTMHVGREVMAQLPAWIPQPPLQFDEQGACGGV
jgi:hypothetical protein